MKILTFRYQPSPEEAERLASIANQVLNDGSWIGPRKILEGLTEDQSHWIIEGMKFRLSYQRLHLRNFERLCAERFAE